LLESGGHSFGKVQRGRRDFSDSDPAGFFPDQSDIGECPTDIEPDPPPDLRTLAYRQAMRTESNSAAGLLLRVWRASIADRS